MDARENNPGDKIGLVRLTTWATAAAVSLTMAGLASLSATGSQRLGVAVAALTGGEPPQVTAQLISRPADIESDRRGLNDAIRLLASDRDRLITRIGSIERNLDDITGSITRQSGMPRPTPESFSLQHGMVAAAPEPPALMPPAEAAEAAPARPADLPAWLANVPEPWPSPSAAIEIAPAPAPLPQPPASVAALPAEAPPPPPPPPAAAKTEFGVDIGSGSNLDEVRALWKAAKAQHGRLLGNLRPIVATREDRTGAADMRLIVGPLANAGAAAKLCASLGAADVMCSTRRYEGQRLDR